MSTSTYSNDVPPRSGFVTALAWIFIALSGFSTLIAVLQNVMITLLFPVEEMGEAMKQGDGVHEIPALASFMFEHVRLMFGAFLLLSTVTLVSAIGLLKRRNWARLVFVGMMGTGIVWNLASLAMPFLISAAIPPMPADSPAGFTENFDLVWKVMIVLTGLMAIGFSAVLGWIIKRLLSEEVRREFAL